MIRLLLAIALLLTLSTATQAQCPNGRCVRPVRTAIAAVPTLARHSAPARTHSTVSQRGRERSVVVRRSRGPGLWARITFRPGRR
jgi:hypothetical protein